MIEQKPLPFDYPTLLVANLIVRSISGQPELTEHQDEEKLGYIAMAAVTSTLEQLGLKSDPLSISSAITLMTDKQYTYRPHKPLDHLVLAIFKSLEYFPENYHDFAAELGPDMQELLCYHSALSKLWRDYASHVTARKAIFNMADFYGASHNVVVYQPSVYPCLYHRGMDINDVNPLIKSIVENYDQAEHLLGFTPAYGPLSDAVWVDGPAFIITTNDRGIIDTISLTTLVGRIWLKGSPKASEIGSPKLFQV